MDDLLQYQGKRCVVTGAASGMGAATATLLTELGAEVIGLDINDGSAPVAAFHRCDLADPASIDAFADRAADALGPLDVLVTNAGVVEIMTGAGADPDEFAASVQVNLLGAHRLAARLAPAMVGRGHGDVVFVTSDVVVRPRTRMAAYVTAKAGMEGLARAMQMELEGTGVRVGMVRPGPSSTEQGTTWSEDAVNAVVADWTTWGHMRHSGALLPRNVADAIVAMVSAPKGTHLTLIEVQPEAPVRPDRTHE